MKNGRNPWEMIATVKARRRAFFRIIRGYNIMAIMAAGINFGKPNTEFIVESDENGVAQSCRNVDTGVEYVGGGGSSDINSYELTLVCTGGEGYFADLVFELEDYDNNIVYGFIVDSDDGVKSQNVDVLSFYGTPVTTKVYTINTYNSFVVLAPSPLTPDIYNISGAGEIFNEGTDDDPWYAVRVSGDCTISMVGSDH